MRSVKHGGCELTRWPPSCWLKSSSV